MSIIKYIEKLQRMDYLISSRSTGSPDEFSEKLGIKRSTLFQYLQEIREMGVEIKYSPVNRSYYYANGRKISVRIEFTETINKTGKS